MSETKRRIDVDGERVGFSIRQSGQAVVEGGVSAEAVEFLEGNSTSYGYVLLERPARFPDVTDYSDNLLRELWRSQVTPSS